MKFKITILAENNVPFSALNGASTEQIKIAWQALFDMITAIPSENHDKATVLSVELVGEE